MSQVQQRPHALDVLRCELIHTRREKEKPLEKYSAALETDLEMKPISQE